MRITDLHLYINLLNERQCEILQDMTLEFKGLHKITSCVNCEHLEK